MAAGRAIDWRNSGTWDPMGSVASAVAEESLNQTPAVSVSSPGLGLQLGTHRPGRGLRLTSVFIRLGIQKHLLIYSSSSSSGHASIGARSGSGTASDPLVASPG